MRKCPKCGSPSLEVHRLCPTCGSDLSAIPSREADDYLGMTVGQKFILRELIGTGGMGKVYRADHIGVGRTVAVKIMHRHLLGDEKAAARFTNEARAASHLNHPHSISVLDFGQTEIGILYIVMEYLRGQSLDEILRSHYPLPFGRVAHILCQAAEAVEAAHKLNIIHRDLKPENIFLEQTAGEDFVKVLDFGIAKILDVKNRSITIPGLVPGTPEYMSPEQARGEVLDQRSDIYSLGVILYEMLTASVPFKGQSPMAVMMGHVQTPPEPPSKRRPNRQIPEELDAIVLRCLAKKTNERFSTAGQLREVLSAWAGTAKVWPEQEKKKSTTSVSALLDFFTAEQVQRMSQPSLEEIYQPSVPNLKLIPRTHTTSESMFDENAVFGRRHEKQLLEQFVLQKNGRRALRIQGMQGMGRRTLAQLAIKHAKKAQMSFFHCRPEGASFKLLLGPARKTALFCLELNNLQPDIAEIASAANSLGMQGDFLPGLLDLFGHQTALAEIDGESRRRERIASFKHLVQSCAARRPLLIFFEELDQYDQTSREMINALTTINNESPVALLFTHLSDFAQLWPPEVEVIKLGALDDRESAEFLRSLFAQEIDPERTELICRQAKGNPLFIEQMGYAEVIEGLSSPPDKVADLVAARVERLGQDERSLLQWISVISDRVTANFLTSIIGQKIDEDALQTIAEKGLLRKNSRDFSFCHPLISIVVYSSIPAEVKRKMHKQVVDLLREKNAPVLSLAFHSYEADEGQTTIDTLRQTAESAHAVLDMQTAINYFSRALEIVRREWGKGRVGEEALDATAVDIARRLAAILIYQGDRLAGRGILEEALSVAATDALSRANLRLDLGKLDLDQGNVQRSLRCFELALLDARKTSDQCLIGEINRELGKATGMLGDRKLAMQYLEQGLHCDQQSLTKNKKAALEPNAKAVGPWSPLVAGATVYMQLEMYESAELRLREALKFAELKAALSSQLSILTCLAELMKKTGRPIEAEGFYEQAEKMAAIVGDRTRRAYLLIEKSRLALRRNEVNQARGLLEQAEQISRLIGWWEGLKQIRKEMEGIIAYAQNR